ncbi:unknown [Clostridium sp. CAG:505]|nr:unknown [Clostridium sp. CAG:505]
MDIPFYVVTNFYNILCDKEIFRTVCQSLRGQFFCDFQKNTLALFLTNRHTFPYAIIYQQDIGCFFLFQIFKETFRFCCCCDMRKSCFHGFCLGGFLFKTRKHTFEFQTLDEFISFLCKNICCCHFGKIHFQRHIPNDGRQELAQSCLFLEFCQIF